MQKRPTYICNVEAWNFIIVCINLIFKDSGLGSVWLAAIYQTRENLLKNMLSAYISKSGSSSMNVKAIFRRILAKHSKEKSRYCCCCSRQYEIIIHTIMCICYLDAVLSSCCICNNIKISRCYSINR
jgi:hypothetical protein